MPALRSLLVLILASCCTISAQSTPAPASPAKPGIAAAEETHISPAEAEELFKSVDEILKFASDDTGLPIRMPVKRELGSRDQVVSYIESRMAEDEDTKRFERTELVLKKFGLLPLDFQLRPFMLKLLREQVAGFYDSKSKTMHLLDWLPVDAQRPVMAHELTHALQDQTVDLDKWGSERTDAAKKSSDPVNAEINSDEDSIARTALVEGQGTAVMVDYMLLPTGRNLENSPDVATFMKNAMTATEGMTVLASAPILLRESLTFPYREGLSFVQALLKSGGKKRAYAEALKAPPRNSQQILHPADYLENVPPPVMHLPDLAPALGGKYERYDVGSIGEFDLYILFKQFADDHSAAQLSPEWRGGMYFAAARAQGGKAPSLPRDLAIIYVSRWSSPAVAQRFATAYGQTVARRFPAAAKSSCKGVASCVRWTTSDGPVTVEANGDSVIALESFDDKTAAALRKLILADSASPAPTGAAIRAANLSLHLAAPIFALLHRF